MKGRGAQSQLNNPFQAHMRVQLPLITDIQPEEQLKTRYEMTHAKSIVNQVKSPDLNFNFSLNPYQGCEHGCSYCYARPTHNYWGFNAGLDFESRIVVKQNAPGLLKKTLSSKSWSGDTIMFSGNTDCYQPAEREFELTRQLLKICLDHRQPVAIITKNDLILRDLDILEEMNSHGLVQVAISVTTLNESLRRDMEPRTSTAYNRMRCIQKLSEKNIPVVVMMAPVIPGLNDHEMLQIAANSSKMGARYMYYSLLRLNDEVADVFIEWLSNTYPKRKDKVVNLMRMCREGELTDSRFFSRMKGSGLYAEVIKSQYQVAIKKYFEGRKKLAKLTNVLYLKHKHRQLTLFD